MSHFDEIQNQESGASVAARIKAAFDYVFAAISANAASLWQQLEGDLVTPKNDKSVYTPNLEVQDDVTLHSLKPESGLRILAINSDGKIVIDEIQSSGSSIWEQISSSPLIKPKTPYTGIQTNIFLNFGEEGDVVAITEGGQLQPIHGLKWNSEAQAFQFPFKTTEEDVLRPVMVDKHGIIRIETESYSLTFTVDDGGPTHHLEGSVHLTGLTYGTGAFLEFSGSQMATILFEHLPNDAYTVEIYAKRQGTNLWHPAKLLHFEIAGEDADLGRIILDPIPGE